MNSIQALQLNLPFNKLFLKWLIFQHFNIKSHPSNLNYLLELVPMQRNYVLETSLNIHIATSSRANLLH